VTGAAGFVGSTLVRAFVDRGYEVCGIDDFSTGRCETLDGVDDDRFEFVKGNVCDPDIAREVVADADWVFHQAAIPSVPRSVDDPRRTTRANCTGTATLVDAARAADVDRFVAASSSSVYGSEGPLPASETHEVSPESPYALSKYYTEQLTKQAADLYGLGTVALRYFNVFGPRQNPDGQYAAVVPKFVTAMLDGERPTIFGDGEQSRDFTYVENVVEANLAAARSNAAGVVCNVGCGDRITVNGLVDRINDYLDTSIEPVYKDPRPGDVRHSLADLNRASETLGYEPVVDFDDGLARVVEHFREAETPGTPTDD